MTRPKEKRHGGNRGASEIAGIEDGSGAKHSPQGRAALFLARVAIDTARAQLDACALATDDPSPRTVEAADLLDAAAHRLAEFSDAIKRARGGDA